VSWQLPHPIGGAKHRRGPDGLRDYMDLLDQHQASWQVHEIVEIDDCAIARAKRSATGPNPSPVGGTVFTLFAFRKGLIAIQHQYGARTDVLDALGLTREERQGLLVIRGDDDDRLYHCDIPKGATVLYKAAPPDLAYDHCELCWRTFTPRIWPETLRWGYATVDDRHWLCPDCFDELKDHYRLNLVPYAD
jgi:hypothetical protein